MRGDLMRAEMLQQPAVLAAISARANTVRAAVRDVTPHPLRSVALVGRGSSDNAAVLGRYVIELASGVPTGLVAPSLHTRYAADVDYRGALVIGLSQSGATPEVVATCERLRAAGAVVVALTNDPHAPLAAVSNLSITTEAGVERAVPATKTVSAQMALLLVISSALTLSGRLHEALPATTELDGLSDAVAEV